VTARTAVAHAAWHGRTSVTTEDVRAAALLALPHRRRRNPFDAPGLDEDLLDEVLGDDDPEPDPDPDPPGGGEADSEGDGGFETGASAPSSTTDGGDSAPSSTTDGPEGASAPSSTTVGAGATYRPKLFTVRGTGSGEAGKRSRAVTDNGRRIGSHAGRRGAIHLTETVRAAAPYQLARGRTSGRLLLRSEDLRVATREGQESNLVLFCVDASGSMAARKRMEQVKAAILSLLLDAYQRRDKVGLVTFRGSTAELVLPPTYSVDIAATRLDVLPAGGRTPLAEGLLEAARVIDLERVRDPRRRPLLVVVTDGRATSGGAAVERSRRAAGLLANAGVDSLVVDCESGGFRMGLASVLAERLGAQHVPVAEVSAEALTGAVRGAA
jgi:magnesium chelatase subunit D